MRRSSSASQLRSSDSASIRRSSASAQLSDTAATAQLSDSSCTTSARVSFKRPMVLVQSSTPCCVSASSRAMVARRRKANDLGSVFSMCVLYLLVGWLSSRFAKDFPSVGAGYSTTDTPPQPDHHQSPLRIAARLARRSSLALAKRPFFDQVLDRRRIPSRRASTTWVLRRVGVRTVMVRVVLLMGVLYTPLQGLSSPFVIEWRVAVEHTILHHVADLTLREVRGGAEHGSSREVPTRSEVVADATENMDGGSSNLKGKRLSVHDLAHHFANHVKVSDEFGMREVKAVRSSGVVVHACSIPSVAGKSSPFDDVSSAVYYRTVDSARSEPICIIPCDWRIVKGQNDRIRQKDSRRNVVQGA